MDYYKKIQREIINAMEYSELTQKQIAFKLKISESALSKYLNNKQTLEMNTIFELAIMMGLDLVGILNETERKIIKMEIIASVDPNCNLDKLNAILKTLNLYIIDIKVGD